MTNETFNYRNKTQQVPKLRHEIIVKMSDGHVFCGRIFIGFNERALDVINDTRPFIPIELENNQIIIIAKTQIMMIDAIEKTSENSSKFDPSLYKSMLFDKEQYYSKSLASDEIPNLDDQKNYAINQYCEKVMSILNNNLFKEKRKIDAEFDQNINHIIEYLEYKSTE